MSFFLTMVCGVKIRNTQLPAAFRRTFCFTGSMAKNVAKVSQLMSWPLADPYLFSLGSAFCLRLMPWVRCFTWPRCGRWPLDLSHTTVAVSSLSTSPCSSMAPLCLRHFLNSQICGRREKWGWDKEDAFPKNSFSSRVTARGRGLKEEVRGLQELPCKSQKDASPSPRHSRGY